VRRHRPATTKLGVPKICDLFSDPKEEWRFEESLKRYPPIAPGTPDPYRPPVTAR